MIKLIDVIQEGKQVGTLYHFTKYDNLMYLINDGYVFKPMGKYIGYLSLTRDKNFKSMSVPQEVRLTLDGDKLAQRYKIEPYADARYNYGRHAAIGVYLQGPEFSRAAKTRDESEERISYKRYPNGIKFKNALLKIEVVRTMKYRDDLHLMGRKYRAYTELLEFLNSNNVQYEIVNNLK